MTELGELPVGFPMPQDVERLQDESARVRLPRPPGTPSTTCRSSRGRRGHAGEQRRRRPLRLVHGTDAIPEDDVVVVGTYQRTSTTPLDEERVHVRWVFTAPRANGPDAARETADLLLAGVSQDIPIWENKVYREHPVLTRSERPILEQRQWARQFYS